MAIPEVPASADERGAPGDGSRALGEQTPLPEGVFCPNCGYDLRGLSSERCPECGFSLDVVRLQTTQIPWVYRRELGWFRAYWRTFRLVSPRTFCQEIVRPVSYPDSQVFRWVTFLHAYLPILAATTVWCCFGQPGKAIAARVEDFLHVQLICGLALAGLPGLASYWFQPRRLDVEQQNRLIALSYYAWAPMALAPAAIPVTAICYLFGLSSVRTGAVGLIWPFAVAYGVILLACEWSMDRLAKHLLHRGVLRRLLRLVAFNLLGLALGLVLVLLVGGLYWLLVVYYSLT